LPGAADDPPQGHSGALKFLPGGALSPPQYAGLKQAVREEVRFNEEVDHPLLIRTFETFVIDDPGEPALHGAVVLAMERAATSLQDVLDTVTPPEPVPDAARVIAEICEALVHVHAQRWVHGDLKPSNVLLMQDGSVRLADFGLARELDGTHAYSPRLGSSDYLPPEWWSERIGAQGIATRTTADIWALGVTAHQLLTGGLFAFPGATARARGAAAQAYADGQADLRLADALAPGWRAVIADCLACDHAARLPHSAAALLPRIQAVAGGAPASAAAPAPAPRRALPRAPVGDRSKPPPPWWRRARTRVATAVVAAGAALAAPP
jgi:serine/threonine protein kinase